MQCGYRLCRKKLRQDDKRYVVHVESHMAERWAPGEYCDLSCWQLEKTARATLEERERQLRIAGVESVVGRE